MNIYNIFSDIFKPIIDVFFSFIGFTVLTIFLLIALFFLLFFVTNKINPFKFTNSYLSKLSITFKPYDFLRWLIIDISNRKSILKEFSEFGFTIFVGRQGSGKTISMIKYLDNMKKKYPNALIVTNFIYSGATHDFKDWRDLMEIRNGVDGVVFAIDEIHSEYSSASWKDFPESLLSEISMQRKQRIKIVATSQVFCRVAKPIREQCFSVVHCFTYFNRITKNVEYDAGEYSTSDNPYILKKKVKSIGKEIFIQSDDLRKSYDTYEKIERMKKLDFIPRKER